MIRQGNITTVLSWCSPLVVAVALASPADAATLYASPTGTATTGCTTRGDACSLASAATAAVAGDTVVLMDGVYQEPLKRRKLRDGIGVDHVPGGSMRHAHHRGTWRGPDRQQPG